MKKQFTSPQPAAHAGSPQSDTEQRLSDAEPKLEEGAEVHGV
jgi:hypothetical protein